MLLISVAFVSHSSEFREAVMRLPFAATSSLLECEDVIWRMCFDLKLTEIM